MPKAAADKNSSSDTETKPKRTSKKASPIEKTKREPSAYNIFMKNKLPEWKAANPGVAHKDAFTAIAKLWADAEENPNRGQATKVKVGKENKKDKAEA